MTTLKEHLIMWPTLIVLGLAMFALMYGIHSWMPQQVRYDCSIAEISPDVPVSVKEECRRARMAK